MIVGADEFRFSQRSSWHEAQRVSSLQGNSSESSYVIRARSSLRKTPPQLLQEHGTRRLAVEPSREMYPH